MINKPGIISGIRGIIGSLILIICFSSVNGFSQDKKYARYLIDTLASPGMSGRGYVNNANRIASEFIAGEMQQHGLLSFPEGYFQPFTLPINTFPGKVSLTVNGIKLKPGVDFIVSASSPSVSKEFKIKVLDPKKFDKPQRLFRLTGKSFENILLLIDKSAIAKERQKLVDSLVWTNYLKSEGYILLSEKERLLYSVSQGFNQKAYPVFEVLKPALPLKPKSAAISVDAVFEPSMAVRNVIGYIPGIEVPDSFIVITAHYDHLGMMGKDALFAGANDNASGVAMMLDMARHYSKPENRPRYSMAFIALAAEETGLNGSEFYVRNPFFPLSQIAFLINLDMVGTGSEGITVVNGKTFVEQYERLVKINADNEYILKVAQRGESCNSDHCPFFKKGVPAVFIYSMGKEHREYHNVYDSAERVPLSEYEDIFRLLRDFIYTF